MMCGLAAIFRKIVKLGSQGIGYRFPRAAAAGMISAAQAVEGSPSVAFGLIFQVLRVGARMTAARNDAVGAAFA